MLMVLRKKGHVCEEAEDGMQAVEMVMRGGGQGQGQGVGVGTSDATVSTLVSVPSASSLLLSAPASTAAPVESAYDAILMDFVMVSRPFHCLFSCVFPFLHPLP